MALFSPVQVTSASFQLTFCAVLGLIWIAPAASRFRPFRGRILGMIVESSILTFGVQLGHGLAHILAVALQLLTK